MFPINIVKNILINNCFLIYTNCHINKILEEINVCSERKYAGQVDILLNFKDINKSIYDLLEKDGFDVLYTVPKKLECVIKKCKDKFDVLK